MNRQTVIARISTPGIGSRAVAFTLVELLVGILAAAVIALTAGTIIYCSYTTWHSVNASVNMHRDTTAAMQTMVARLRECRTTGVTVGAGSITMVNGGVTSTFRKNGANLEYDPSTAVGGNTVVLVRGSVTTFTATALTGGIRIVLLLTVNGEPLQTTEIVTFRNS